MATFSSFRSYFELRPGGKTPEKISHVLFDFDGTISLIREGWQQVMVPMFVEMLPRTDDDTEESVQRMMLEDITRLTGKQTIYQMIQFADRVKERGGEPKEPLWYKNEYLRRLHVRIEDRLNGLRDGTLHPDKFLVFGARKFLECLTGLGVTLYLASGTDEPFVKDEAKLLDIEKYFEPHVYGALDDYKKFSKKMVIERILNENKISGAQLLGFGDGYVEIENTKEAGGFAVAVATDEANNGLGQIDEWKRERLIGVGADIVVADFRDGPELLEYIWGETISCPRKFDHRNLKVFPVSTRKSLSTLESVLVDPSAPACSCESMPAVTQCANQIKKALADKASVMLIFGAHLIKNGGQLLIREFMKRDWTTHCATNGASTIHDWEFSWLGRSTESVRENVATGSFGTWDETGRNIHVALLVGGIHGEGYGEALGRFVAEDGTVLPTMEELETALREEPLHPFAPARAELLQAMKTHGLSSGRYSVVHEWKDSSILAQSYLQQVPLTVHPGIGYDIITNHPLFSGAAIGRAAHIDFQRFSAAVEKLDGNGVVLSVGSAIMGPQVFEKALSCVNNIRIQEGRPVIKGHHIYVVDLQDGGSWDWTKGEPPRDNPAYYLRFCKSYSRMGGTMHYLQCDNIAFLHNLFHELGGTKA